MAQYRIPTNAGPYRAIRSRAGTPLVTNDRTGKNKVLIPCKNWKQAEELCRKLNEGDHQGVVHG